MTLRRALVGLTCALIFLSCVLIAAVLKERATLAHAEPPSSQDAERSAQAREFEKIKRECESAISRIRELAKRPDPEMSETPAALADYSKAMRVFQECWAKLRDAPKPNDKP
jgi:hypothetical protein